MRHNCNVTRGHRRYVQVDGGRWAACSLWDWRYLSERTFETLGSAIEFFEKEVEE